MSQPNKYRPHTGLKQILKAAKKAGKLESTISRLSQDMTDTTQVARAMAALTDAEQRRLLAYMGRLLGWPKAAS